MRVLIRFATVITLALLGAMAASAAEYTAGEDYQVITPPQPTGSEDQVQVAEIFWYGCPHCYDFEPLLNRWAAQLPDGVSFVHIPAAFGDIWETHARAYYTATALGVEDKLRDDIFAAIHEQGMRLDSEDALAAFFAEHGVPEDKFRDAYNSFAVNTQLQRSKQQVRSYGVTSVPTLVIDGRYRTDASMTGGFEGMLDVAEFLIQKAE